MNAHDLIGKNLAGFSVVAVIEVFSLDSRGYRKETIGLVRNSDRIPAGLLGEINDYGTQSVLVLTDGKHGFKFDTYVGYEIKGRR